MYDEDSRTNSEMYSKYMMTSSNGNIFRVTGPLCGEFTGHRWIALTKASKAELWCFLWSVPWINDWVNNREAGDLRRQRANHDVIVRNPVMVAGRIGLPSNGTSRKLFELYQCSYIELMLLLIYAMLLIIVLYCAVLYCIVLYCIVLYCIPSHRIM